MIQHGFDNVIAAWSQIRRSFCASLVLSPPARKIYSMMAPPLKLSKCCLQRRVTSGNRHTMPVNLANASRCPRALRPRVHSSRAESLPLPSKSKASKSTSAKRDRRDQASIFFESEVCLQVLTAQAVDDSDWLPAACRPLHCHRIFDAIPVEPRKMLSLHFLRGFSSSCWGR